MNVTKHRKRKGNDCPICKMHFGWRRQFEAHIKGRHCEDPAKQEKPEKNTRGI